MTVVRLMGVWELTFFTVNEFQVTYWYQRNMLLGLYVQLLVVAF